MNAAGDVLILGGGVIGLTTAYFLAREGVRVTIVDKGELGQEASWAGAGIVPPGVAARSRTPYDRLRALSAERFPALSAELRERTGIDNGYAVCGGLEFLPDDEAGPATDAWRDEGIAFDRLGPGDLRRLEPALADAPAAAAYHLPGMAQVRNPRHLKALIVACEQLGVRALPGRAVEGFEKRGDRIVAVRTVGGRLSAGQFVLAAGAWTGTLLDELGRRTGIRPVRGQIVLLRSAERQFRPVLLLGKRYLVPRSDGRVLAGATEEDAGFVKRTTAAAVADLIELARGLVPVLAEAEVERCWAGLRPGSPDGLPFLGSVPGWANVFVAAGHFRAGIQLSPATGLAMTDLLLGRPPCVSLEAFRLDRDPAPVGRPAFPS